jgi:hypothetical protein
MRVVRDLGGVGMRKQGSRPVLFHELLLQQRCPLDGVDQVLESDTEGALAAHGALSVQRHFVSCLCCMHSTITLNCETQRAS